MSDKIDIKRRPLTRDKERFIMMKVLIQDTTLVNIYSSNKGECKYIKQILMGIKGEIDSNTATHWPGQSDRK